MFTHLTEVRDCITLYSVATVNHITLRGDIMQRKQVNTLDLVAMFTVQHLTLREIGRVVGMSAAGVSKRLRFAGIASLQGTWITRPCGYCGEPVSKPRSRGKRAEALYCGTE